MLLAGCGGGGGESSDEGCAETRVWAEWIEANPPPTGGDLTTDVEWTEAYRVEQSAWSGAMPGGVRADYELWSDGQDREAYGRVESWALDVCGVELP